MKHLKYCAQCGGSTLLWDGEKRWSCSECDYVLFHNCAAAVAVVLRCGDEIMLTRRNREPGKGKFDLAGGFADPGESMETTCVRELYEELQLVIHPERLRMLMSLPNVYHYKGIDYNTLDVFFEYELDSKFTPVLEVSEVSEIIWIPLSQVNESDIAFASQQRFFERYKTFVK